jgi:hypothetical protein
MGQWQPDAAARNRGNYIFVWSTPANMSGGWDGAIEAGEGRLPLRMNIRQEFQRVSGAVFIGRKVVQVRDVPVEGEEFAFSDGGDPRGGRTSFSLRGAVTGEVVTGTVLARDPRGRVPFTARRDPFTRFPSPNSDTWACRRMRAA